MTQNPLGFTFTNGNKPVGYLRLALWRILWAPGICVSISE